MPFMYLFYQNFCLLCQLHVFYEQLKFLWGIKIATNGNHNNDDPHVYKRGLTILFSP